MIDNYHYEQWSNRIVLSECLKMLGFEQLGNGLHRPNISDAIISSYIKLAANTAKARNRQDVLEKLCYSNLIYG